MKPHLNGSAGQGSLLEASGVEVRFPVAGSIADRLRRQPTLALTALDGVDLTIERGEAVGLVGESGCGKSTLARCIVGIQRPDAGLIRFDGASLDEMPRSSRARMVQMVFQDPYSSLNPRLKVGSVLTEVLRVHDVVSTNRIEARVVELLSLVGLDERYRTAYPAQLSGGQRQRVAIARALALEPTVLVADEPTSALDVSIQASVLNLLVDLRERLSLTLLFISHDIAVVRHLCDRVAVMYLGRIVEQGPTAEVLTSPRHPYTASLLRAAPHFGGHRAAPESELSGDPPSPLRLPEGCRFHPRCPLAQDVCRSEDPPLAAHGAGHAAACHYADEAAARFRAGLHLSS